ncbi:MAG: hypothetical protein JXL80_13615, partial [Planctomycetes bacterium]|nr:hypothetical protein [Planctomycetota bacterium]
YLTLLQNENWVYQNTGVTMSRGGHYLDLQAVVENLNGNNSVTLAIEKLPGSGDGEVLISDHPELDDCWRIRGSMRNNDNDLENCGDLTLRVTCTGDQNGETTADALIVCRPLGDLDGNGGPEPTDMSILILALNGMAPPGYTPRTFDLDANGGAEPGDLSLLINVLNGLPIS